MTLSKRIFRNREDAGKKLGNMLEDEYKDRNVLVLGIPRGGVEIAYHVAKILNGELSIIVSKKLPFPVQEELAFGALTEDGSVYLTELGEQLDDGTIDRVVQEQFQEIERRIQKYREGRPIPDVTNRIVIIVDDGIATGSTIVPVLKLCKEGKASKIVVAAPVSGHRYAPEIKELANEVKVLEQPDDFFAVGQVYEEFEGLEDKEVTELLKDFQEHKSRE